MAGRRGVSRGTRAVVRRKWVWARAAVGQIALGPNGVSRTNLLANFETLYGAQLIGTTVMRIRGIVATTTDATGGFQRLRMAAKVESTQDPAPSTVDGPYGSEHDDWMLWEPFATNGASDEYFGNDVAARVIDVQSARRLEELGEELQLWFQAAPDNQADTQVALTYELSVGLKLP